MFHNICWSTDRDFSLLARAVRRGTGQQAKQLLSRVGLRASTTLDVRQRPGTQKNSAMHSPGRGYPEGRQRIPEGEYLSIITCIFGHTSVIGLAVTAVWGIE
jgi:hypothetical protein